MTTWKALSDKKNKFSEGNQLQLTCYLFWSQKNAETMLSIRTHNNFPVEDRYSKAEQIKQRNKHMP